MMNKKLLYLLSLAIVLLTNAAHAQTVNFTDSNLPIVVINTDCGNADCIPDDPKVGSDMKIIYRGAGQRNYVADQTNPTYLNYNGRIAIETRGHSSQNVDKKPYGFETRLPDNITNQNVSLLGMPAENDWILAPNAFDPTYMHNVVAYQLSNKIGLAAMRTVYCEVIINGDYRGIYVLTESIKIDKNRIDVAKILPTDNTTPNITGGYITKTDWTDGSPSWSMASYNNNDPNFLHHEPKPTIVTLQQDTYVKSVFFDLEAKANNANLTTGYPTVADTKSFIEYMLIAEIGSCVDAYQYSTYYNKDRGGKLNAGPVWDFDLGMGTEWGSQGGRGGYDVWQFNNGDNQGARFWKDLYDNPTYHCAMKNRWQALRTTTQPFYLPNIHATIDSISTLLTEAAAREQQRWAPSPFAGEVLFLKNWFAQRVAWIDANIATGYTTCVPPTVPNLVINEIMYQPQATTANPNSDDYEYIELKNAGTTPINLSGIYLRNGVIYQFPANATLSAGQIIVIASNAAAFQAKYGFAPFGQYFRNLSNAGEEILLVDGYGQTIDKVKYADDLPWANADSTGKALELINVTLDNNLPTSWFVKNTNGGSPNAENNYIAPCGSTYPAIVINEINYNSGGGINPDDWVELHNPTTNAVNISGWILKDGSTGTFTFPTTASIPANGYVVLCKDTTKFKSVHPSITNYVKARMPFGLSGSGDIITLQSPTTCEIDNVLYGVTAPWTTAPDGTGSTLSLNNPTLDNTLANSWAASTNQGGSPGRSNINYNPPTATFAATPIAGIAPLVVTISGANASTDDGTIVSYQWTFGDGTTFIGINPPQKTYTTTGTYKITLKTTDNDGYIDTYQQIIQAGGVPLADFTLTPQTTTTTNPVTFDASTSVAYGGKTITNYTWNFGDGTTGTGINTTHTYSSVGSFVVTLTITDNANFTDTHTDIVYVTGSGTTTLIPYNGNWQYKDNNSDQNTTNPTWKTAPTLTPAWATGNAELGYGDGDEATIISFGANAANKHITTYFRKVFSVANAASISALELNMEIDDGAIAYLNGSEIARYNMPTGIVAHNTLATTSIEDQITTYTNIPASLLINGNNVLAIEVHQGSAGSSDLSMNAELKATISTSLCTGTPPNVVINEIMYNAPALPTTANSGDWIELYNATPVAINLQYWALQDNNSTLVLPNITMQPNTYLVLCEDTTKFKLAYPLVTNFVKDVLEFGLNNNGEQLTLRNNTGCIVDSLSYKNTSPWATTPDGSGYTLSLKMPNNTINNGIASSWEASYALGGTPGATNVEQAVKLNVKALLGGAYNTTTGLMRDNLRSLPSFPLTEPYTAMGIVCNGETTTAAVLSVAGSNAIVDWIVVELRSNGTAAAVIKRRAALLQADGDIVDIDGVSPVKFTNTPPGNYFLALRHRNHLGIMTAGAVGFDNLGSNPIDFSSTLINLYGTNPIRTLPNGKRVLWAGDANADGKVVYVGMSTDVNAISVAVFTNPANTNTLANIPLNGYHRADLNLDGKVVYAGAGTDVNVISSSVFTNPANTNTLANVPVFKQLP
jgi:PKD repeat protein